MLALIPSISFASIDTNLAYKTTSPEVTELQDFLQNQGILKVAPTGYFGLKTLSAVKTYQASKGISPTGFVGPITRKSINSELEVIVSSSTLEDSIPVVPIQVATTSVQQVTPIYITAPIVYVTPATGSPSNENSDIIKPMQPTYTISSISSAPYEDRKKYSFTVSDNPTNVEIRFGTSTDGTIYSGGMTFTDASTPNASSPSFPGVFTGTVPYTIKVYSRGNLVNTATGTIN